LTRFVLDASVSLAWFVDGPIPPYAEHVRNLISRGARCVVPMLWHLEMANGLAMAERRRVLTRSDCDHSLAQIEILVKQAIESDADSPSVRRSFLIARQYQLSAYDAVYLEAALRLKLPLATLDKKLAAAAPNAGATLLA
jgi:predicted nucleic acid-binding protein